MWRNEVFALLFVCIIFAIALQDKLGKEGEMTRKE